MAVEQRAIGRDHCLLIGNITFAHAAVPAHNGTGIRAEGNNLTIEHSRFIDNENGILGGMIAGGTVRILDSEFPGNGKCYPQCAHGVYVGAIDRLDVEQSRFVDQHVGHHIKSRALLTVLIDNYIADGPDGNSSYLADIPNSGDLLMGGSGAIMCVSSSLAGAVNRQAAPRCSGMRRHADFWACAWNKVVSILTILPQREPRHRIHVGLEHLLPLPA